MATRTKASPLIDSVAKSLELELGDTRRIVVGFSGGLDSTVLLTALAELRLSYPLEVCAVHVHHGLRDSADRDACFCRRYAADLGIPCFVEHLQLSSQQHSVQAEGRRRRYAVLSTIARRHDADTVVTGHHLDDWIETAVMKIRKASGLRGITSLERTRSIPLPEPGKASLRRPLLAFPKETLRSFAETNNVDWVTDPTNQSTSYTRNQIRHTLLDHFDSATRKSTGQVLKRLAADFEALESNAERWLESSELRSTTHSIQLQLESMASTAPQVCRYAIRIGADRIERQAKLSQKQLDRLISHLSQGGSPQPYNLCATGLVFRAHRGQVRIETSRGRGTRWRDAFEPARVKADLDTDKQFPRALPWFGSWLLIERFTSESPIEETSRYIADPWVELFDETALSTDSIQLGTYEKATSFRPFGMSGSKQINDLFRESGVPVFLKSRWPVVGGNDGQILWVPGLRRSESGRVTEDSTTLLKMSVHPAPTLEAING
jgi:tRNA(Ile)-lysidine synthase